MYKGLLPIGTVVVIGDSKKKVMIVGVGQRGVNDGKIWDYTGVVFPEGFIDAQKMFLFNNEQITEIYAMGLQNNEQLLFKEKIDEVIKTLKEEQSGENI